MYCPVFIMSPDLSLAINGKQRSKSAFVSPTIFYSTMLVGILSEWMRAISKANVDSCERFPHISIPKTFLTSAPNKCPKSVLKIARLDSSFAKYTFIFLRYPANFNCDTSVSVVVSFLYESIVRYHNVSYRAKQSRFKIVGLCCFG